MTAGLTRRLGKYASGIAYRDVPAMAWNTVRAGFTDCAATMIAGRVEPVVRMLKDMLGAGREGDARLCFSGERARAPDAAWINGTAAHALDYDELEIRLVSGTRCTCERVGRPRGHPANPLREGELWAKFEDCIAAGGGGVDAARLFERLQRIDTLPAMEALYA